MSEDTRRVSITPQMFEIMVDYERNHIQTKEGNSGYPDKSIEQNYGRLLGRISEEFSKQTKPLTLADLEKHREKGVYIRTGSRGDRDKLPWGQRPRQA